MSNKLTVSVLREELQKRGLDTTGLKPALVSRLDAAIAQEQNDVRKGTKRKPSSDPSPDIPIRAEVAGMSDKKLEEALLSRGLSTHGSLGFLLRRLSEAIDAEINGDPPKDNNNAVDVGEPEKDEEVAVAVAKGPVPDQYLPENIKQAYHVYETKTSSKKKALTRFDAMLNQTDIMDNSNKFFVLQVLEENSGKKDYYFYTRWGRVGKKGQDKLLGPFKTSEEAVLGFKTKFSEKTKNNWENRHKFKAHSNKYTLIEIDYEEKRVDYLLNQHSKLDNRLYYLIQFIFDRDMMMQMMKAVGYDARKSPLGKLKSSIISKGYEILKGLADILHDSSLRTNSTRKKDMLQRLSSEFYTIIPHDFGFQNMQLYTIDTPEKLREKLQMVEALGEIESATKIMSNDSNTEPMDPAYNYYKSLYCELEPLDELGNEFKLIEEYVMKTHDPSCAKNSFSFTVLNVFKVQKEGESECFKPFEKTPNRMLLWHGSPLTNWVGILSKGLRIPPPGAPACGYMFGKGVYFADSISRSAYFCNASHDNPVGVLLLCEVALGDMQEHYSPTYDEYYKLPSGKLSTKGVGRLLPNPDGYKTIEAGVVVPVGELVGSSDPECIKVAESRNQDGLYYNEYIVYNTAQIRMRYLVQVKFEFVSDYDPKHYMLEWTLTPYG